MFKVKTKTVEKSIFRYRNNRIEYHENFKVTPKANRIMTKHYTFVIKLEAVVTDVH